MEHRNIPRGELHGVANWSVAAVADRDVLSVVAADVGKVCHVRGDKHYVLVSHTPMLWESLGGDVALASYSVDSEAELTALVATLTVDDIGKVILQTAGPYFLYISGVSPFTTIALNAGWIAQGVFANLAALNAFTPTIEQLYMAAITLDTGRLYWLKSVSPAVWMDVSSDAAAHTHPLGGFNYYSALVEDFDGYYGTTKFLYTGNADVTRSAVTGAAHGMSDAHGCVRVYKTGFAPYFTFTAGSIGATRTFKLSANPIVLFASFAAEAFGTAADNVAYFLGLTTAAVVGTGNPLADNSIMLMLDSNGSNVQEYYLHTKSAGVATSDIAVSGLTVNTRINVAIVATSTAVKYYINGVQVGTTHTTNIPTGSDLLVQFGGCSFGVTAVAMGVALDTLGVYRDFATPRTLQLPTGYGS